jgi:ABC-type antimicrobial peptide transport system permease subunit
VIYDINTFEDLATASLSRQRFLLLLFGIFAALALLLACIGIYGVLAYLGSQRVPEIGVRMALGATAGQVLWMVLRQSLVMIFSGIALGSGGAWLATLGDDAEFESAHPVIGECNYLAEIAAAHWQHFSAYWRFCLSIRPLERRKLVASGSAKEGAHYDAGATGT